MQLQTRRPVSEQSSTCCNWLRFILSKFEHQTIFSLTGGVEVAEALESNRSGIESQIHMCPWVSLSRLGRCFKCLLIYLQNGANSGSQGHQMDGSEKHTLMQPYFLCTRYYAGTQQDSENGSSRSGRVVQHRSTSGTQKSSWEVFPPSLPPSHSSSSSSFPSSSSPCLVLLLFFHMIRVLGRRQASFHLPICVSVSTERS